MERSARPPSARTAVRAGASGSPNAAHASPREHTRSQSSSETSHPTAHALLESPELRSRHGVQLMGSPTHQHTAMLFDLQQQGHVGLPPPPAGMRSISPGLRLLGPGLSGGEGSSDGGGGGLGGGLSGGGFLSGMSQLGGGGNPFATDLPSIDYLALHNPRAGAAMLHGYGDAGMMHGGSSATGGPLAMRMLSGSGMRSPRVGGSASAVQQLLGHHPDSVLASASVLDSRLGSAPGGFMVSGTGGGPAGLVVHSGGGGGGGGGLHGASAAGAPWRYAADPAHSHSQGFLSGGGGGPPHGGGGFSMPAISTQPQSSPSISDSNCRWVRPLTALTLFSQLPWALPLRLLSARFCTGAVERSQERRTDAVMHVERASTCSCFQLLFAQTVSPNVHSSIPRLQQQTAHQAAQQQQQQLHHHHHSQGHAMADMGQMSSMGSAIKRTMSEPVVSNENVVCSHRCADFACTSMLALWCLHDLHFCTSLLDHKCSPSVRHPALRPGLHICLTGAVPGTQPPHGADGCNEPVLRRSRRCHSVKHADLTITSAATRTARAAPATAAGAVPLAAAAAAAGGAEAAALPQPARRAVAGGRRGDWRGPAPAPGSAGLAQLRQLPEPARPARLLRRALPCRLFCCP